MKRRSRQLEVVQYERHCASDDEQAQSNHRPVPKIKKGSQELFIQGGERQNGEGETRQALICPLAWEKNECEEKKRELICEKDEIIYPPTGETSTRSLGDVD